MIDIRVSVIPAINGENVVIRILDQNKMTFDISMLGFSKENEQNSISLFKATGYDTADRRQEAEKVRRFMPPFQS